VKQEKADRINERLTVAATFPVRCPSCGHVLDDSPELERVRDQAAVVAELELRAEYQAWFAEHASTTTQGLFAKATADVFGDIYRKEHL
jgi:hypothetical protein